MLRHRQSLAPAAPLALPLGAAADIHADADGESAVPPAERPNGAREQRFDWADAGIGAGGAHGLAALFLGAGLSMPNPRRRD
jgi:hypothetical protein